MRTLTTAAATIHRGVCTSCSELETSCLRAFNSVRLLLLGTGSLCIGQGSEGGTSTAEHSSGSCIAQFSPKEALKQQLEQKRKVNPALGSSFLPSLPLSNGRASSLFKNHIKSKLSATVKMVPVMSRSTTGSFTMSSSLCSSGRRQQRPIEVQRFLWGRTFQRESLRHPHEPQTLITHHRAGLKIRAHFST